MTGEIGKQGGREGWRNGDRCRRVKKEGSNRGGNEAERELQERE